MTGWTLLTLILAMVGCTVDVAPTADASVEPDTIDPDFFGEPCPQPSTLEIVYVCRPEIPYPNGICTPSGVCRPPCGYTTNSGTFNICKSLGGVERWIDPDADGYRGVCWCEPP